MAEVRNTIGQPNTWKSLGNWMLPEWRLLSAIARRATVTLSRSNVASKPWSAHHTNPSDTTTVGSKPITRCPGHQTRYIIDPNPILPWQRYCCVSRLQSSSRRRQVKKRLAARIISRLCRSTSITAGACCASSLSTADGTTVQNSHHKWISSWTYCCWLLTRWRPISRKR